MDCQDTDPQPSNSVSASAARRDTLPGSASSAGDVQTSYRHCHEIARRSASSFYWSFRWLPHDKRRAMWALYAFSRLTDDLGDSRDSADRRRAALTRWHTSLQRAFDGQFDHPIWPALMDAVRRYDIPRQHLLAIVEGVSRDIEPARYETFAELRRYCYLVASAVGLACIHIWGFRDPRACTLADHCGVALQLTNILRDLKEDAMRGRVYLPLEDLRRFRYSEDELRRGVMDARYRALMDYQIKRAAGLFDESGAILDLLHEDGRTTCAAMLATYRQLLAEIQRRGGDVFTRPVRLSQFQKLKIGWQTLLRTRGLRHAASRTGSDRLFATSRASESAPSGENIGDGGHS
jgi:phytoene synthase